MVFYCHPIIMCLAWLEQERVLTLMTMAGVLLLIALCTVFRVPGPPSRTSRATGTRTASVSTRRNSVRPCGLRDFFLTDSVPNAGRSLDKMACPHHSWSHNFEYCGLFYYSGNFAKWITLSFQVLQHKCDLQTKSFSLLNLTNYKV